MQKIEQNIFKQKLTFLLTNFIVAIFAFAIATTESVSEGLSTYFAGEGRNGLQSLVTLLTFMIFGHLLIQYSENVSSRLLKWFVGLLILLCYIPFILLFWWLVSMSFDTKSGAFQIFYVLPVAGIAYYHLGNHLRTPFISLAIGIAVTLYIADSSLPDSFLTVTLAGLYLSLYTVISVDSMYQGRASVSRLLLLLPFITVEGKKMVKHINEQMV